MATTYKIVGGDGNEYGPIPLEQLQLWIKEGRLSGDSYVAREGDTAWSKASDFPELGIAAGAPAVAVVPAQPMAAARPVPAAAAATTFNHPQSEFLMATVKSSASWFWWIAALTAINTIAALAGSEWGFYLGVGVCQIVDHIAVSAGSPIIGVIFDVFAIGLVVLLGWFAIKAKPWAFMLGMILFGLDSLIYIIGFSIFGIFIHGWAVFSFYKGFVAAKELRSGG